MKTLMFNACSLAIVVLLACSGCGKGTFCCELPDGSCISVKNGVDANKECTERGGVPSTDKVCENSKCVPIPAEKLGCCQLEGNCATTTKKGCITGVWQRQWVCENGRCVRITE